ncbi:MAG: helix-turn-helix domain-containing protein, partial [Pseudomonadota bacterium]
MALLEGHRWPGNIRELRNLVEATFVNSDAERFGIDDIPALHRLRLGREPEEELYDAARLTTALRESGGNKSRAARALNCSRTTVYRRLRKLEREAIRPSG